MAMNFTSRIEGRVERRTDRLAEAERLLAQMREQSARDLDLIEQWCADEGEECARAAADGLAVGRYLLSEIDAFLTAPAAVESEGSVAARNGVVD